MNKLVRVVAGGFVGRDDVGEGGLYGFKHSGEPDGGSKFTNFMEPLCLHLVVIMGALWYVLVAQLCHWMS